MPSAIESPVSSSVAALTFDGTIAKAVITNVKQTTIDKVFLFIFLSPFFYQFFSKTREVGFVFPFRLTR